MDKAELRKRLAELSKSPDLPARDDVALVCALEDELLAHWDDIPETTRATMLGLAAVILRPLVDQQASEIRADMAISRARGVPSPRVLVDREFVVEVSHEEGTWIAVCDALGLVTEAENYEALTERALLILPELALENRVMEKGETAQIVFEQCQPSEVH